MNVDKNYSIQELKERVKELNCLYQVEEILNRRDFTIARAMSAIVEILPTGWQFPDFCNARISVYNKKYQKNEFQPTQWILREIISVQEENVGFIEVFYSEGIPNQIVDPFLDEERKLLKNISLRISNYLLYQRLKNSFEDLNSKKKEDLSQSSDNPRWNEVLKMLKMTDQHLFAVLSRKMINHLFCKGIKEAKELFQKLGASTTDINITNEINRPSKKQVLDNSFFYGFDIYNIASNYFSNEELLGLIQKWIYEERSHFLLKALANQNIALSELSDSIRKYYYINPISENSDFDDLISPINKGIRVSLIRRFLTDQLQFIDVAKNYINVHDFYELLQNMIFPSESNGKLGGKTSGLILALKIFKKNLDNPIFQNIKSPKTWFIPSDGTYNFIYYNNLEDVIEQKYKSIDDIRQEYPHIMQAFKNSHFSPEITNGLSRALDDFGDSPIIVRSSSLLEDRLGTAFAGKYKSLFLGNQGTKKEKLEALMDAIAEVYASIFSPDPIGYRAERGLLDFHEEMGIMIQEVVGKRIGKYFFPAFAGVAFSTNEFRWSPRIKREDGLIRIVPGLGTRAVDRIGNDYPVLISPGKPDLRVNLTLSDYLAYSPRNIDVINLEKNTFETIPINKLIEEVGNDYPAINDIFSIIEEKHLKVPVGLGIDTKKHEIIPTFDNLINKTDYIKEINEILSLLRNTIGTPVDIEFASDGESLYLLQCRPQSYYSESASAVIPKDIPNDKIIFTAKKHVSGGRIPDANYIVYIDPQHYVNLSTYEDYKNIGRAVGKLNYLLTKKTFILLGPGRWGSRDDFKMGVSVSYSDICNTSLLVEIARKKGNYVPDLSFGTHFFQDLVESSIYYLPLYPDEENVLFNQDFFDNSPNTLNRFIPEFEQYSSVIKVINVPEATGGDICRILMDSDNDEAICFLANKGTESAYKTISVMNKASDNVYAMNWRLEMVNVIAMKIDRKRFGVKNLYLFGTTFLGTAGANSDIDILVHFDGNEEQRKELQLWFDGWNLALSEINFQNSGYRVEKMLDVYILTDKEISQKEYYAHLIDEKANASKKL